MKWGEKLQELRRSKGWTQAELATRTGISQPTIADYERGNKQPTLPRLQALASAFEVGLDTFILDGDAEAAYAEILARVDSLDAEHLARLAGEIRERIGRQGKRATTGKQSKPK